MVEGSEMLVKLSHLERGRAAAAAAQQKAFANTEEAMDHLFTLASHAERSSIRSFDLFFENQGNLLKFPDRLT